MARKKVEIPQLLNWDQVNDTMAEIAEIDRKATAITSDINAKVDALKEQGKSSLEGLTNRKKQLELMCKDYSDRHRPDFGDKKSLDMPHCIVSYRLTTKVKVKNPEVAITLLAEKGLHQCIRVKKEVDKVELGKLPADILAQIGAEVSTSDEWGYEIKQVLTESH